MPRLYIKGIGMMAGLIIGAGVFALPYAFYQAGIFGERFISPYRCLSFIFAPVVRGSFFLHQRQAPVCRICGNVSGQESQVFQHAHDHRRLLRLLARLRHYGWNFSGQFHQLVQRADRFFLTLLFFAAGGLMALFKVSRIAEINFYLTMPIIGFIIYLLFFLFRISKRKTFSRPKICCSIKIGFCPTESGCFLLPDFRPYRPLGIFSSIPG